MPGWSRGQSLAHGTALSTSKGSEWHARKTEHTRCEKFSRSPGTPISSLIDSLRAPSLHPREVAVFRKRSLKWREVGHPQMAFESENLGWTPLPPCQEGLWSPLGLRWEDRLSEPPLRAQWHHVTCPLTPIRGTPSPLPQWKLAANEAPEGPRVRQPPPSSAPSQPSGPPSLVWVVGKADLFILLCPPTSCHCWGVGGHSRGKWAAEQDGPLHISGVSHACLVGDEPYGVEPMG